MTDVPMGGRGGVGIRLWVEGGEVVKRTFGQVGDSGRKMWAEIALGEKSANPALRGLSRVSQDARGGLENLAGRAGVAGNALSAFGTTGVAVAAGLGGLILALAKTREAMNFAAVLTDTSDRLGVSAERLQELRFVADEAGVPVSSLEADLEKLTGTLGKFKAGIGDGKLKPWFQELGISKSDLDSIQTADELMMLLADRLGQVKDRSKQVAAARAFGIEDSLPILRLGQKAIADYSEEARRLGLVMDDDVRGALDRADRQMEIAQQRIDMSLRLAVAGLADEFATLVGWVASAVHWLTRLASISIENPGERAGQWVNDRVRRGLGLGRNPREAMRDNERAEGFERAEPFSADAYLNSPYILGLSGTSGFEMQGHSSGGGGGANRAAQEAERRAEQRRQRELRAADARGRAWRDFQSSLFDSHVDLDEASARQVAKLERDRAERLKDLARQEEEYLRSGGLQGLSAAEAAMIRKLDDARHAQDLMRVDTERLNAGLRHRLETEEAAADATLQLLGVQVQMVGSTQDRLALEREMLVVERDIARKRLALEVGADPNLTDAERRARLGGFDRQSAAELALFDQSARDELQAEFHAAGRQIVDAVEDGRLGEHIAGELKDRLIDMALSGLFDFLNPRGGAGGESIWSVGARIVGSLFGTPGPGRAGGGDLWDGRRHPVVEHGRPELMLIGGRGHVVGAEETARLIQQLSGEPGSSRRRTAADMGALDVTVRPSPLLMAEVRRTARAEAESAARQMGAAAVTTSLAAAPGRLAEHHDHKG